MSPSGPDARNLPEALTGRWYGRPDSGPLWCVLAPVEGHDDGGGLRSLRDRGERNDGTSHNERPVRAFLT